MKKGDKCIVAILENSNRARHVNMSLENIERWTFECVVTKVGRKYISVESEERFIFDFYKDNFLEVTNYSADYKLYSNIEEVYEERERKQLLKLIRNKIGQYGVVNISVEKLKMIQEILNK